MSGPHSPGDGARLVSDPHGPGDGARLVSGPHGPGDGARIVSDPHGPATGSPAASRLRRMGAMIRRANAPGPAEDSLSLRSAALASVVVGIAAVAAEHELAVQSAAAAIVAVVAGMAFSYLMRNRSRGWVKVLLAIAGVAQFVFFVQRIVAAARIGNLPSVIVPLADLFVWIQVIHAFDVPARRDLAFSLAGGATLVAIAAAQAVDMGFLPFVVAWLVTEAWGLSAYWQSMAERRDRAARRLVQTLGAAAGALMVALAGLVALPAAQPLQSIKLPSSIHLRDALANPGLLSDAGPNDTGLAQPGRPGGRIGIGGFVGFSGSLDTGLRGSLSNEVVMHVRATRPGYWLGETFDRWDGESWTQPYAKTAVLGGSSPFFIPTTTTGITGGQFHDAPQDVQTFYVAVPLPNLIFAAEDPVEVWFPDFRIFVGPGRAITTGVGMEGGTIYTVISRDTREDARQLALAMPPGSDPSAGLPPADRKSDLQLPHAALYARVRALARSITAGAVTTEDKVQALLAWMHTHLHYSTDIPPLPAGADAVDQFLFVTHTGFCEQISTSLAAMLRSLGIPAREAVGYVPGSYNPFTDLYDVAANDAHAWVQVWFGPAGWQDVDPTAVVPFANPTPAAVIAHDLWALVRRTPPAPAGLLLAICLIAAALPRRIRRARLTWAQRVALDVAAAGARAGTPRRPSETLREYTERLLAGNGSRERDGPAAHPRTVRAALGETPAVTDARSAVALLERTAYGDYEPAVAERAAIRSGLIRLARRRAQR